MKVYKILNRNQLRNRGHITTRYGDVITLTYKNMSLNVITGRGRTLIKFNKKDNTCEKFKLTSYDHNFLMELCGGDVSLDKAIRGDTDVMSECDLLLEEQVEEEFNFSAYSGFNYNYEHLQLSESIETMRRMIDETLRHESARQREIERQMEVSGTEVRFPSRLAARRRQEPQEYTQESPWLTDDRHALEIHRAWFMGDTVEVSRENPWYQQHNSNLHNRRR